jgi:hypothetical protein
MDRATAESALIADGVAWETVRSFVAWHSRNPSVWRKFENKALALIAKGKQRWGAKAIFEVIRYERAEEEGGQFDDYAVNNNYPAYYARIFAAKYPQHSKFFEFRAVKGLKEAA